MILNPVPTNRNGQYNYLKAEKIYLFSNMITSLKYEPMWAIHLRGTTGKKMIRISLFHVRPIRTRVITC